jgi:chorismate dehydratase
MPKQKFSIALVNYLNAKPFLFGLQNYRDDDIDFDVQLLNPAQCALAFKNGEADIALVPSGSLHQLNPFRRVTRFGIAADDEVRTVCLFSNDPPEQWKEIILDNHSMTSVLLSKIIIKEVLDLHPDYIVRDINTVQITKGQAALMIGDKVFTFENQFSFKIDLASAWKKWTGLPFVFAVWIAKPHVPPQVEAALERMFDFGLQHIEEVIQETNSDPQLLQEYYQKYIQYSLNENYVKGLDLYLTLTETYRQGAAENHKSV